MSVNAEFEVPGGWKGSLEIASVKVPAEGAGTATVHELEAENSKFF